jgi:hypothetical protein
MNLIEQFRNLNLSRGVATSASQAALNDYFDVNSPEVKEFMMFRANRGTQVKPTPNPFPPGSTFVQAENGRWDELMPPIILYNVPMNLSPELSLQVRKKS